MVYKNDFPKYAYFETVNLENLDKPHRHNSLRAAKMLTPSKHLINCLDDQGRVVATYDMEDDEYHILQYADGRSADIYVKCKATA